MGHPGRAQAGEEPTSAAEERDLQLAAHLAAATGGDELAFTALYREMQPRRRR